MMLLDYGWLRPHFPLWSSAEITQIHVERAGLCQIKHWLERHSIVIHSKSSQYVDQIHQAFWLSADTIYGEIKRKNVRDLEVLGRKWVWVCFWWIQAITNNHFCGSLRTHLYVPKICIKYTHLQVCHKCISWARGTQPNPPVLSFVVVFWGEYSCHV